MEDIGVISKSKDARSRRVGSQQVLGPDDGTFRLGLEMMTMQAMDEDDALGKSKAIWYINGIQLTRLLHLPGHRVLAVRP